MVVWQLTETNFRAEIPLSSKRGSPWEQSPSFLHKFGKTQVLETIGESWAWIYNLKKNREVSMSVYGITWCPQLTSPQAHTRQLYPQKTKHKLDKQRWAKKGSGCRNNPHRGKECWDVIHVLRKDLILGDQVPFPIYTSQTELYKSSSLPALSTDLSILVNATPVAQTKPNQTKL